MNETETLVIYRYYDRGIEDYQNSLEHWAGEPKNSALLEELFFDSIVELKAGIDAIKAKRPWVKVVFAPSLREV